MISLRLLTLHFSNVLVYKLQPPCKRLSTRRQCVNYVTLAGSSVTRKSNSCAPLLFNSRDYSFVKLFIQFMVINRCKTAVKGALNKLQFHIYFTTYGKLSVTEMDRNMNYSSAPHLSNQFKIMTGPTHFRQLKDKRTSSIK